MTNVRKALEAKWGSLDDKLSVNDYADVGAVSCPTFSNKIFAFDAADNTLTVQILGSYDGGTTYDQTAEAAFDVTTASQVVKTITAAYTNLKVQVKSKVGGSHGTLSTKYFCN